MPSPRVLDARARGVHGLRELLIASPVPTSVAIELLMTLRALCLVSGVLAISPIIIFTDGADAKNLYAARPAALHNAHHRLSYPVTHAPAQTCSVLEARQ